MRVLAVSVALTMVNLTTVPLSSAAASALEPGVALALAQWRAKHYRDVRYALRIELREGSDLLQGNLELQVKTPRKPVDLVLDWRGAPVRDARINNVAVVAETRNEHLVIASKHLKGGTNTITLAFESPVAVSGSARTARTVPSISTRCSCPPMRARSSPASTSRT